MSLPEGDIAPVPTAIHPGMAVSELLCFIPASDDGATPKKKREYDKEEVDRQERERAGVGDTIL